VKWRLRPAGETAQTRLVEEFAATLAGPAEFRTLRAAIASRFLDLARCDAVLFCEFQQAESGYVVTSVAGGDLPSAPLVLPSRGNVVQWLQVNEEVLQLSDDRGAHEYLEPDERELLTRLGVRGCLPLLSISRLAGILLLVSTKRSWRLRRSDHELLLACGRQAALAWETVGRHGEELARVRSLLHAQRLAVAGQLAAAVAHEIRNPLTAIRSTMQFALASDRPWEQKRQWLEEMVAEVDRIEKTVSSVLSLARPSQLEVADLDLVGIVEEAILLVESYGDGRGVTLVRRLPDRPLIVQGDPRELRIVFVNILMNACQATERGGTVTIQSDRVTHADSLGGSAPNVETVITDTGCGMTTEMRDKAFEPFVTTKKTGTGLGLSICLDIVTRHSGQIHLTSEVGRGTRVAVRFPLRGGA
jgi:signal transduction histidine kinase